MEKQLMDSININIQIEPMLKAVERNVHVDEAHGFPPGYTAADLTSAIVEDYIIGCVEALRQKERPDQQGEGTGPVL